MNWTSSNWNSTPISMNLNSIKFKNLNTKFQINIKFYKLNWIPIDIDWNYMQLICYNFENIHLNGIF